MCSVFCRFEMKLSDLLSWIKTWKTSAQVLASSHPETTPDAPDLQEKLKVNLPMIRLKNKPFQPKVRAYVLKITLWICVDQLLQSLELELTAKEATASQVIQEGRGLMDQLERGMKERGDCPHSLTLKWCFILHNKQKNYFKQIHPGFAKHVLLKCANIVSHIYRFSEAHDYWL